MSGDRLIFEAAYEASRVRPRPIDESLAADGHMHAEPVCSWLPCDRYPEAARLRLRERVLLPEETR